VTATLAPPQGSVESTEWSLVAAAQQGDATAYADLYGRYQMVVFRFCLFRLQDRHLAEDITSETFLRALRRIDSLNYMGKDIGAWFVTIARNLILDHLKHSRTRLEFACGEVLDGNEHSIITRQDAFGGDPAALVAREAVGAEVRRCLAELRPDWRDVLTHRFIDGKTVAETAALMGRQEGAIKALQLRATRALAKRLPEGIR
jgi:RNA polymerase sigma-70 factor (ECF subfamily)